MKNKVLTALLFLSLCCVYLNFKVFPENKKMNNFSELTLANIEALGGIESLPGNGDACYSKKEQFEDGHQAGDVYVVKDKWEIHTCYRGEGINCTHGIIYYIVNYQEYNNYAGLVYLSCRL